MAVGIVVLLVAGGVGAWVWSRSNSGDTGSFHVEITGPSATLFNGTVHADNATALTVLLAASESGHFAVLTREYPGMGAYVYSIGGFTAHDSSGWIYEVHKGAGWVAGDRSASLYPIHEGEDLRWRWVDSWSG